MQHQDQVFVRPYHSWTYGLDGGLRGRPHAAGVPEMPRTQKSLDHWRKNVDSFWGALDEDFAMGASAQSTFASGANTSLRFGATQWCSARFHADVEAAIAR